MADTAAARTLARIDRSASAVRVWRRLQAGNTRHLHVSGRPGFGKAAFAEALAALVGNRAAVARLELRAPGEDPLLTVRAAIDPFSPVPESWPTGDRAACWADIARLLATGTTDKVIIITGAEHLADPSAVELLPSGILALVQIVTVSIFDADLFAPNITRLEAEERSEFLGALPPVDEAESDYGPPPVRWRAQSVPEHEAEGKSWFKAHLAARQVDQAVEPDLKRIFERKHLQRRDDLWDGHPLINLSAVEDMLDLARAGGTAKDALDRWQSAPDTALRDILLERLLPFIPTGAGGLPPAMAEELAKAARAFAEGEALDDHQRRWLLCAGLVVLKGSQDGLKWSKVTGLIPAQDVESWAKRLQRTARRERLEIERRKREQDHDFRALLDKVKQVLCEPDATGDAARHIDVAESRVIVPRQAYSFRLYSRVKDPTTGKPINARSSQDVLVFEAGSGDAPYWRQRVRILSMLGRMRHPALGAFLKGGVLDGNAQAPRQFYVLVDRVLRRLPGGLNELIRELPARDYVVTEGRTRPPEVFRQIVDLAEALDLVHAQGIIHRAIDFSALAIDQTNNTRQIVLTDFEYASSLQALRPGSDPVQAVRVNPAVWNLPCRAPETQDRIADVIDPSVDVYAFGALAIMLATGLPGDEVQQEIDDLLSFRGDASADDPADERGAKWQRACNRMRADLMDKNRWPDDDPNLIGLRNILFRCIEEEPASRPNMPEVMPQLQSWFSEVESSLASGSGTYYLRYAEDQMANAFVKQELVPPDTNLDSAEGRALMRDRLQSWVNAARWIHFRESGFPGRGTDEASSTRAASKYLLAGKNMVLFASVYRKGSQGKEDPDFLFINYVMWRHQISLNDPANSTVHTFRRTTEDQVWVHRPKHVIVIRDEEVDGISSQVSWAPLLAEVSQKGHRRRETELGREAALAWRLHRDILLAQAEISEFPVTVEPREEPGHYDLVLDVDAWNRDNTQGNLAFHRSVLVEGEIAGTFFANTINSKGQEDGSGQVRVSLISRASRRKATSSRIAGTLQLPAAAGRVCVVLDDPDATPWPMARMNWPDWVGNRIAIGRMTEAIDRLERRGWLMDHITTPRHEDKLWRQASAKVGEALRGAADTSELKTRIEYMLSSDPLHAVQGPPGTGKTTLMSEFAAEIIAAGDGSRMLVTSQSHAATDNVLMAIMHRIGEMYSAESRGSDGQHLGLRLFSDATRDSVDSVIQQRYGIDGQVSRAMSRMQANAKGLDTDDPALAAARRHLRQAAKSGYLEIRAKIERSTPVLFATTSAAMTAAHHLRRGVISYDHVLIDEAARAFSIDLVQPMSLADKVVWVGDQDQLPPFGDIDLTTVLQRIERRHRESHQIPVPPDVHFLMDTARIGGKGKAGLERLTGWLKLFHRLFDLCPPPPLLANYPEVPVTQSLNRQFRSVEAVGSLVADTFYPEIGIRHAGPSPDYDRRLTLRLRSGDTAPPVAWIDTSALTKAFSRSEGTSIVNESEARIVAALLEGFAWQLDGDADIRERLRILSPYKAQVGLVQRVLAQAQSRTGLGRDTLERICQTVDSAQGSEADIIILSFARRLSQQLETSLDTGRPKAEQLRLLNRRIRSQLGFLARSERINVMMSRARQQIVLIGDFEFFKTAGQLLDLRGALAEEEGVSFWTRMLKCFRKLEQYTGETSESPVIIPADMLRVGD